MELGHITEDAYGVVIRAPSRRALQRAVQKHQEPKTGIVEAIQNLLSGMPQFAVARGGGTVEESGAEEAIGRLPVRKAIVQELQALVQRDPELLAAFVNLRTALADPQMRPTVSKAVEAFARAAKRGSP